MTSGKSNAKDGKYMNLSNNGRGGGVEGCKKITPQLKKFENEHKASQKNKDKLLGKRQRVEREISISFVASSNIRPSPTSSGVETLNNLWKSIEKQEVDDAWADAFYACTIPFNVSNNPYFINAIKKKCRVW